MGKFKAYAIEFAKLANGEHTFEYSVNDAFFAEFPESRIKHGQVECRVTIDKEDDVLQLLFETEGSVNTTCDRCLNSLAYPIQSEDRLIVTLGSDFEEQDADVIVIPGSETELNVAQYIYEYIHIALPMIINCDGLENVTCDEQILKYINHTTEEEAPEEPEADPRWNALKELKSKKDK